MVWFDPTRPEPRHFGQSSYNPTYCSALLRFAQTSIGPEHCLGNVARNSASFNILNLTKIGSFILAKHGKNACFTRTWGPFTAVGPSRARVGMFLFPGGFPYLLDYCLFLRPAWKSYCCIIDGYFVTKQTDTNTHYTAGATVVSISLATSPVGPRIHSPLPKSVTAVCANLRRLQSWSVAFPTSPGSEMKNDSLVPLLPWVLAPVYSYIAPTWSHFS